jgi:hypothetical protein
MCAGWLAGWLACWLAFMTTKNKHAVQKHKAFRFWIACESSRWHRRPMPWVPVPGATGRTALIHLPFRGSLSGDGTWDFVSAFRVLGRGTRGSTLRLRTNMRCKNTKLSASVMDSVFYGCYLHNFLAAVQPLLRTMAPKMSKQRRVPLGAREVTINRPSIMITYHDHRSMTSAGTVPGVC